jgi:hypothetical protein
MLGSGEAVASIHWTVLPRSYAGGSVCALFLFAGIGG